jgi:TP901 family phage tail tape measure protein
MVGNIVEIIIAAKDLTAKAFATSKAKLTSLQTKVGKIKQGFGNLGSKISGVMSAAIVPIMLVVAAVYAIGKAVGSVIGSFGDFESAMKRVQKTTGMSSGEIETLGDAFKNMSKQIPLSAEDLADIGAVAGQLGIQGVENIETFTEVVAKTSIAFDMTAEEAATSMAKIGNAFRLPIEKTENFASSINTLENTTAATAPEIIASMTRMAASGAQLGLTAAQSAALSATLVSTGMAAERTGTRMNTAFTQMAKHIGVMAEQMGISQEELRHKMETDVMGTLNEYLIMLAATPSAVDKITKANEVFGAVGGKAIAMLSSNFDALQTNLGASNEAMLEGTSLNDEYLIFASSFQSQMELMKNKVNLVAIAIGEKLAPAIFSIGTTFTDTVIPALAVFSEEIGKQTSETWPNFKDAVNDAFTKMTGGVTFQEMMEGMGAAIGIVIDAILLGLTWVIDKLDPVWTEFGKGVEILSGFLADIKALGFGPAIVNLFETMKNEVLNVLGILKDKIVDVFSGIKTAILDKLSGIKDKMVGAFEDSKTAIVTALADLPTTVGTVFTTIGDKIKNFGKKIPVLGAPISSLGQLFIDIGPVVTTTLTDIKTKVSEKFAELPTLIGNIFTEVGEKITAFGDSLPDIIGGRIAELGDKFSSIGDSFKIGTDSIKTDIDANVINPISIDVPSAIDIMKSAMGVGVIGIKKDLKEVQTETGNVGTSFKDVVPAIDEVKETTNDLQEAVEKDMDKVSIDVDGTKVTFEGLKGKVDDVVGEFENFEDIAGKLIGLDWSVFTTLEAELPGIDRGIGDMKTAFEGLKTVLDDNIDNLESIQTDLGNIESTITPFVNNIAPGVTAIGNFASALSDTQSALSTFASMSTVDIKGMIGFSTAIHSMVTGLKILDGQIGNLMPSFENIASTVSNIISTFMEGSSAVTDFESNLQRMLVDSKGTEIEFYAIGSFLQSVGIEGNEAYTLAKKLIKEMKHLGGATEESFSKLIEGETYMGIAFDVGTFALKSQTGQLNKISGAIEPLISFLQTLGTLMDLTLGEDAIIPDLVMLQEAFASLETTMLNLGTALQTVDMSTPITQAITDSEDFRTSMEENGAELAILMTYIETLMGYYVDLAQTMADLSKLQEELGEGGLDVGTAFGNIRDYIEGLTAFIPDLATALIALKTVWDENSDAIHDGIDAFNEVMGAITNVKVYMDKWIQAELDIETATDNATEAVSEESVELENLKTPLEEAAGTTTDLKTATEGANEAIGTVTETVAGEEGALTTVKTAIEETAGFTDDLKTATEGANEAIGIVTETIAGEADELAGHSLTTALEESTTSTGIFEQATSHLRDVISSLISAISEAAYAITGNFHNAILSVGSIMASVSASAYGWGHSLMYNFVEGIYSEAAALQTAMASMASIVDSYMGVSSNTKLGALSHLEDFGPNLVHTFSEGIREGLPNLNKTLTGLSLGDVSLNAGMAGSGSSTKTVYMTIHQSINNREDARYAVAEIEKIMRKPAIL